MAQWQHVAQGLDYEKASDTWNVYGSLLWDPCPKAINMDLGQFIYWVCGTRTQSIKFPNINVLRQGGVPGPAAGALPGSLLEIQVQALPRTPEPNSLRQGAKACFPKHSG